MNPLDILEKIELITRLRIEKQKRLVPIRHLMEKISDTPCPKPFAAAFRAGGVNIIAEIKRSSPSVPDLATTADPVGVAEAYLENGAKALSVLTEPDFFGGSIDFLRAIRSRFPESLLLMKDFIVEEYQIAEARLSGANAVLLIVALLSEAELHRLSAFAKTLGLNVLVEVHDETELGRARDLKAEFIGINSRSLKTMEVRLETLVSMARHFSSDTVFIAESGIQNGKEIRELSKLGYRGFLVGTSLMRGGKPGEALAKLVGEALCT
jgi:indole-3-glycerol phosphate synthase